MENAINSNNRNNSHRAFIQDVVCVFISAKAHYKITTGTHTHTQATECNEREKKGEMKHRQNRKTIPQNYARFTWFVFQKCIYLQRNSVALFILLPTILCQRQDVIKSFGTSLSRAVCHRSSTWYTSLSVCVCVCDGIFFLFPWKNFSLHILCILPIGLEADFVSNWIENVYNARRRKTRKIATTKMCVFIIHACGLDGMCIDTNRKTHD